MMTTLLALAKFVYLIVRNILTSTQDGYAWIDTYKNHRVNFPPHLWKCFTELVLLLHSFSF